MRLLMPVRISCTCVSRIRRYRIFILRDCQCKVGGGTEGNRPVNWLGFHVWSSL